MGKFIGAVFVAGFAIAALLVLAPILADAGGADATLDVTKTVVGLGPTGPYTIQVTCTGADTTPDPGSFDLNDGESQVVLVDSTPSVCTVTETGTQSASTVSYACGISGGAATCDDDQTVTYSEGGSRARVDITNTFPEPEPEAEPAVAEPVEAAPTFTG